VDGAGLISAPSGQADSSITAPPVDAADLLTEVDSNEEDEFSTWRDNSFIRRDVRVLVGRMCGGDQQPVFEFGTSSEGGRLCDDPAGDAHQIRL
jgi:hypothetical protein